MSPRARQAKSKARLNAYEQLLAEDRARSSTGSRSTSRPARAWATSSSRPEAVKKAFGDNLLFEDLNFTCRAAASSASSARTAPARPRCSA